MKIVKVLALLVVMCSISINATAKGPNKAKGGPHNDNTTDTIDNTGGSSDENTSQRDYLLYTPSTLPDNGNVPLVIVLHGLNGNAESIQSKIKMDMVAYYNGFYVLYPQGTENITGSNERSWNAGRCCNTASKENIDDVSYINELINQISSDYRIDTNRIYMIGFSNGGMMGYRFACETQNIIRSLVVVSGTSLTDTCMDNSNLKVMAVHGSNDTVLGTDGSTFIDGVTYNSISESGQIITDAGGTFESLIINDVGHALYEIQLAIYQSYSKVLSEVAFEFMNE